MPDPLGRTTANEFWREYERVQRREEGWDDPVLTRPTGSSAIFDPPTPEEQESRLDLEARMIRCERAVQRRCLALEKRAERLEARLQDLQSIAYKIILHVGIIPDKEAMPPGKDDDSRKLQWILRVLRIHATCRICKTTTCNLQCSYGDPGKYCHQDHGDCIAIEEARALLRRAEKICGTEPTPTEKEEAE